MRSSSFCAASFPSMIPCDCTRTPVPTRCPLRTLTRTYSSRWPTPAVVQLVWVNSHMDIPGVSRTMLTVDTVTAPMGDMLRVITIAAAVVAMSTSSRILTSAMGDTVTMAATACGTSTMRTQMMASSTWQGMRDPAARHTTSMLLHMRWSWTTLSRSAGSSNSRH